MSRTLVRFARRVTSRPAAAIAVAVLLIAAALPTATLAAEIAVEKHDGGAKVTADGKLFADYLIKTGPKPIVWPIIGPTGKEMTRAFPMRLDAKDERKDHLHHRSLWFTHGSVNDVDFWSEPSRAKQVHREYVQCDADGKQAVISTINDWIDGSGKKQCEDLRKLTFRADGDTRSIDFDVTVKASDGPVKFGDTKEGSMGVRIPSVMDLKQTLGKKGGNIVNANGERDGATWGKSAPWVDYHGQLDGELVGIAILNHPSSFRYPTYWHVRDYGLFAANPFGLHDFKGKDGKEHEGEYTLPAGETVTFRYRILFHKGDEAKIAEAFDAYSKESPAASEATK